MFKKITFISIALFIVLYLLIQGILNTSSANSFAFSYVLLIFNTLMISMTWVLNLSKINKLISVFITFCKYPIILFSIFWASQQKWIEPIGLAIGVCAFLIIIVITVGLRKKD